MARDTARGAAVVAAMYDTMRRAIAARDAAALLRAEGASAAVQEAADRRALLTLGEVAGAAHDFVQWGSVDTGPGDTGPNLTLN